MILVAASGKPFGFIHNKKRVLLVYLYQTIYILPGRINKKGNRSSEATTVRKKLENLEKGQ
jgi:hypothetical protein